MGKHYGLDIPTLHELRIDVDKQWLDPNGLPREITDLKAIAAAMAQGDIIFRGSDILQRLPPEYGIGYNFLHIQNTGMYQPEWMDIEGLIISLTGAVNRMVAPPTLAVPIPGIGVEVAAASSPPGRTATLTLAIPAPSISVPATATYSPAALDGAIADDGGVQTDETDAANDPTANDMTLLPAVPAVNDAYYFGLSTLWDWLSLNIGQAGAGTWTIVWEYWNGSTWATLPGAYDTSNGFRNGGYQSLTFSRPGDWATSSILLMNLFWVRARVSAYTSVTTQPLGTQAWIGTH